MKFLEVCKQKFDISAVEPCQMHFSSLELSFLSKMKKKIVERNLEVVNIPVDVGDISQVNEKNRKKDIEALKRWLDIGKELGSPSIRVNTGKRKDRFALERIILSYQELVDYAENIGMKVLIENHGGVSNQPEAILRIIEEVNSPNLRTCPDFGEFSPKERYEGLQKLVPYAFLAHAKTYQFDSRGEEKTIDISRCLDILRKAGYKGYLSIESEGRGDQFQGVMKTKAVLERYL
ncbi:sugar phosphate isomerase/epimerase [Candidatus Aerophobetes bacterium]|nr:sugar phosphate isomerase/epimerase [Candidatus Aerophobetes bacterium]